MWAVTMMQPWGEETVQLFLFPHGYFYGISAAFWRKWKATGKENTTLLLWFLYLNQGCPNWNLTVDQRPKASTYSVVLLKFKMEHTPWEASEKKVKSGLSCFLSCVYDLRTGEYYDWKFLNLLTKTVTLPTILRIRDQHKQLSII